MMRDVRLGFRLLWTDKSFSATVLLTLGLCVGGNVAVLSVVYPVLLKPLSVPEPDRLVLMVDAYPNMLPDSVDGRIGTSVRHYLDRLGEVDVFEEQALYQMQRVTVDDRGGPERLVGKAVTPSFFRLVGVAPRIGRIFTDEDDQRGNTARVILSDTLWRQRFGEDTGALGQQLRLNGQPHEIVGVMPADFRFLDDDTRFWVPMSFSAERMSPAVAHAGIGQTMLGRLKSDATIRQARTQIHAVNARDLVRYPEHNDFVAETGFHTLVLPLQADLVRDIAGGLYLLWGGGLFVLLIGCVNVGNLMLLRATGRLKELAVRRALGAGRWRLTRQLIAESVVLMLLSALVGLMVGAWGLGLLETLGTGALPRGDEVVIDGVVVASTLGVALVLGFVLGLAPLASLRTTDLRLTLSQEGRGGTGGRNAHRIRRGLVTAQVSIAFVLLSGAMLLLVSFQRVLAIDPGFSPERLLTASVSLRTARYPDAVARRTFFQRALEGIRTIPGVAAAGLTTEIPFGDCCFSNLSGLRAEGYVPRPGEADGLITRVGVDEAYFDVLDVPLIEGRFFDDRDMDDLNGVFGPIIIDDRLAGTFWPNQSPLGRRLYAGDDLPNNSDVFTVVGVVRAQALTGLVDRSGRLGNIYYPSWQTYSERVTFAIRTRGDPYGVAGGVRDVVGAIDPELALFDVRTMDERVAESLTPRRLPMWLSLGFAFLALLLSAIGTYGVQAYRVTQRRREFGIRMALGSTVRQVFTLVLSEGMTVLLGGLGLGAVGAFLLRKTIASQLYDIEAMEPIVLIAVAVGLSAVVLLACALPARRATRIAPMAALKCE